MKDSIALMRMNGIEIGENVVIAWNNLDGICPALLKVGNNVIFATGSRACTHDAAPFLFTGKYRVSPIVIGDNVFIGYNSMILPGVTIGSNVIIGAMSLVTHDIPDNSVAVGIPAAVVKTIQQYLSDLNEGQLFEFALGNKSLSDIKMDDILMLQSSIYKKMGLI